MLFKILHGDSARISTDITPYHEGYCYVTYDGDFYVDMNNERVKLNAKDAETLGLHTVDEFLLKNELLQPDWNQTDETKVDYIKNKPDIEAMVSNQVGGLKLGLKANGIVTISIEEE